jgi:hypothetical protein
VRCDTADGVDSIIPAWPINPVGAARLVGHARDLPLSDEDDSAEGTVRDVPGSDVVPAVECRVEVPVDVVMGPLDNSRFESPLAGSNEGLLVTPAFASMGLRSWRDGSIVNVCGVG